MFPLSKIRGIVQRGWGDEYFLHGETCILIPKQGDHYNYLGLIFGIIHKLWPLDCCSFNQTSLFSLPLQPLMLPKLALEGPTSRRRGRSDCAEGSPFHFCMDTIGFHPLLPIIFDPYNINMIHDAFEEGSFCLWKLMLQYLSCLQGATGLCAMNMRILCSHLQLSSCMIHVWTSIGKFLRSIGQESIKVNLKEYRRTIIKWMLANTHCLIFKITTHTHTSIIQ